MNLCKQDLLMDIFISIEGNFDTFCSSKDKANFLNLQGKLEPPWTRRQKKQNGISSNNKLDYFIRSNMLFRHAPEEKQCFHSNYLIISSDF